MIPETVSITITENDLVMGHPRSFESCPIALAAKRQFPHATDVQVDGAGVYLELENDWYCYGSDAITEFVMNYDQWRICKPQTIFAVRRPFPIEGEDEE